MFKFNKKLFCLILRLNYKSNNKNNKKLLIKLEDLRKNKLLYQYLRGFLNVKRFQVINKERVEKEKGFFKGFKEEK